MSHALWKKDEEGEYFVDLFHAVEEAEEYLREQVNSSSARSAHYLIEIVREDPKPRWLWDEGRERLVLQDKPKLLFEVPSWLKEEEGLEEKYLERASLVDALENLPRGRIKTTIEIHDTWERTWIYSNFTGLSRKSSFVSPHEQIGCGSCCA